MKILNPPAIGNLDELLDLLLHPDKYAKYLKQLQEVRDSITTQLETYNTKEKADDYLAQAQAIQAEALATRGKAEALVKEKTKLRADTKTEIAKIQEELKERVNKHEAAMKERERTIATYDEELKAKTLELNARDMALQEQEAALERLSAKLTTEQDKMEQRKALLNAV